VHLLNELLDAILPANRFYAAKLGGLRRVESIEDFKSRAPFTTKDELVADHEAHPPYGSGLTRPQERYTRFHQTSGTKGRSLVWLDDPEGWEWVLWNWRKVWEAAGVAAGDSAFFPFSFGPFLGFWGGFEAAAAMGVRVIPGGGLSSENRLRLIERHRPHVLCCTPTYALRLAEVGARIGLEAAALGVALIVVCGEPGGSIPAVRDRIARAWRARVVDHHGMTEAGPVTFSDPEQPDLLRIIEGSYLAEVIDPATGEAVEMGTLGELVLTTLGRYGSPLLRYRTGDLVKPVALPGGDPGEFALEGGIIGRADDMVVVRGVNVFPSAIDAVVRACDGVGEYQVEVDQRGSLPEIRLVIETTGAGNAESELAAGLEAAFPMRIPVRRVDSGTLPVFEGKAKRWKVMRD